MKAHFEKETGKIEAIKRLTFAEPAKTLTAKEIAALTYTEMMAQIEAQEAHCTKERGVGGMASELLQSLRQGGVVEKRATEKRNFFFLNGEQVKAFAVRQLISRGYLR